MARLLMGGTAWAFLALCGSACSSETSGADGAKGDAAAGAGGSAAGSPGSGGAIGSGGGLVASGASSNGGTQGGGGVAGAPQGGTGASGGAAHQDASTAGAPASLDSGTGLPGWTLTWSDEFSGPAGTAPDATRWVHETGGNGWGNNELEYYTDRTDNAALDGNGSLVITAKAESFSGRNYTSARLTTQGKFDQAYGRFEARLRIPKGQGIWPAFWLLGNDIGAVGWPACGETDIMENIGKEPTIVHGTIHGPNYGPGGSYSLPGSAPFADDFHVYATEWEAAAIRFYVDGALYKTLTPADLPNGAPWAFDHPFFILLNVAVGGQWPGNPDGTTAFPQTMLVDYVRVYKASP